MATVKKQKSTRINLNGQKYGRLSVGAFVGKNKHGHVLWECTCECGDIIITSTNQLRAGKTKSCGCLSSDTTTQCNKDRAIHKSGTEKPATEYRAYSSFLAAKNRCTSGNKDYGERGIKVKISFEELLSEIGERPEGRWSLDRIDVNGHYESGNIRWANDVTQARNQRRNKTSGVCQRKKTGNWRAYISENGKMIMLGTFPKKEDAIKARKEAMKHYGYC